MEGSFPKAWDWECSPSVYETLGSISRTMKNNKTKQQPQKNHKGVGRLRKPKGLARYPVELYWAAPPPGTERVLYGDQFPLLSS